MKIAVYAVAAVAVMFSCAASAAECPDIGPAPRTGKSTAAEFAHSGNYSLDANGILVNDYGSAYNNLGKFQNPYFISNYANLLYQDFLISNCSDREILRQFILQADWFVQHADHQHDAAVWRYPFAGEAFDLKPGWISGIGQARIAGVLQRAFAITGNAKYHEVAEAAMKVYEITPAEGGVASPDGDVTWFEEAANTNGKSYKILNGHITALAGILDFAQITKEKEWRELYERGVAAVKRDIAKFDTGFLSYYSLASPRIRQIAARGDYNNAHVHQLIWLYQQTDDPVFLEWASRFRAYEVNSDTYTAKGSVDPKGHGPDQAAGYYGSHYWSQAEFPTWLQVDVGEQPTYFKGIAVHGGSEKASPRDYSISARLEGKWRVIAKDRGNADLRRVIKFTYPVLADAFRIDILADNGNRNVAIQAFMPIRATPQYAAVADACNYYPFYTADHVDTTWLNIKTRCAGWIMIPTHGYSSVLVVAAGDEGSSIQIEKSDDLATWTPVSNIGLSATVDLPAAKYIRLSFGEGVRLISRIEMGSAIAAK